MCGAGLVDTRRGFKSSALVGGGWVVWVAANRAGWGVFIVVDVLVATGVLLEVWFELVVDSLFFRLVLADSGGVMPRDNDEIAVVPLAAS